MNSPNNSRRGFLKAAGLGSLSWVVPKLLLRRFKAGETVECSSSFTKKFKADALEIQAAFFSNNAESFGVKARVSPNERDFTRIFFDVTTGLFGVEGTIIERNREHIVDP